MVLLCTEKDSKNIFSQGMGLKIFEKFLDTELFMIEGKIIFWLEEECTQIC